MMPARNADARDAIPRAAAAAVLIAASLIIVACKPAAPQDSHSTSSSQEESPAPPTALPASSSSTATLSKVDAEYAALLKEIVDDDGLVKYWALEDAARFNALKGAIERMAAAPLPDDAPGRIALLCNAYNANAMLMTFEESRKPGFTTVQDASGFFDARQVTVAGKSYTLNALKDETRSLRDPRVHCALVWGAMSCPPLLNEPYAADRLERQLNDQCRRWIEDKSRNITIHMGVQLSDIIGQHEEDFKVEPYGDFKQFVYKFAQPNGSMRTHLKHANGGPVQVTWWPFNWSLNQAPRPAGGAAE